MMLTPMSAFSMSSVDTAMDGGVLRRLRFRINFNNPYGRRLTDQRFWCYLPLRSETQFVSRVKVSVPHVIEFDDAGHQVLGISFDAVPEYYQGVVSLEVDIGFKEVPPATTLLHDVEWLRSERLIESDAAEIVALAGHLRHGSDAHTVDAIYNWVAENIGYAGFVPDDLGASYALENRQGDCTEYAYLVVALARANKIPARVIGGYFAEHDFAPKPQDYHNWAEVFLEGRWCIVDAQKRYIYPDLGRYVAFRIYRQASSNGVGTAHRFRIQGQLRASF